LGIDEPVDVRLIVHRALIFSTCQNAETSTAAGDAVLDPCGGSGTTIGVCERAGRHWLGTEIDFCPRIGERVESDAITPRLT
jgi:hypothetical protein